MALVSMAVYHPAGITRWKLTKDCLESLIDTVDPKRHRLVLVNNASPDKATAGTLDLYGREWRRLGGEATVIHNAENRGTARAVNQGWAMRRPGEAVLKIDDDVVLIDSGWLDRLEECLARDPKLGILGLKRRDLEESPHHPKDHVYHSTLEMLPHKPGERWLVVERVGHVMGTCQLYASGFLDRVGYLYQMGRLYGLDDSLMAYRCKAAGFYSAFYVGADISHPDPGGTEHQEWKQKVAGESLPAYGVHRDWYAQGVISPYHGPDDDRPVLTELGEELLAGGRLAPDELRLAGLGHLVKA